MKNADIAKIRQLLKEASKAMAKWIADVEAYQPTGAEGFMAKAGFRYNSNKVQPPLDKALALLPCETCNGTKQKYILDKNYSDPAYAPPEAITVIPCPDCQS